MVEYAANLDAVFKSLDDPTRRDILRLLTLGDFTPATTGSPETAENIQKTFSTDQNVVEKFIEDWGRRSVWHQLIPKATSQQEVGDMAAFMASDRAGSTTGTLANMSAGMVLWLDKNEFKLFGLHPAALRLRAAGCLA